MTAYIIILHALICAFFKTAGLDKAPLVVAFFDVLPVDPGRRHDVAYVVDKFAGEVQVAFQSVAAGTYLAHPKWHSG